MPIVLIVLMLTTIHSLNIMIQSTKETCFTLNCQEGHRINLHIFSHDKTQYQYLQYFILGPDMRIVLRKPELSTQNHIIRNQLKAKKDGKYQLCIKQTDNIERFIDVAFSSSGPITTDSSHTDNKVLDEVNFQAVLIDFDKDYQKSQELIDDLEIMKTNHLEVVKFMDHNVEEIKKYQYAKVYIVFAIVLFQLIIFSFILKNKEQLSIV